jgi:L-seryl-tRNA(Ser) seleniumtransferase
MKTPGADPKALLRTLPSVERILSASALQPILARYNRTYITDTIRNVLATARRDILAGTIIDQVKEDDVVQRVNTVLRREDQSPLRSVINATGTVLHTNLGRALLAKEALDEMVRVGSTPVTLEYDIAKAGRGDRDDVIEADVLALTGAEAATVVNNNAAAVLLALNTLAEGKEGIVSRGELIEIGGAFRIPDVMRKSGVILREVGTTNRTHPTDYAGAISAETGVLLKVHTSNYRIIGFTAEVGLEELVVLGREHNIPVMEDLGAGALIDLSQYGLPKEPIVAERIAKGADVVTFSGDKLLGGPQAGLIVGRKEWIDQIKTNPLKRALRLGKLTLAALSATLRLYRRSPDLLEALPTLRWLTRPIEDMEAVAAQAIPLLRKALGDEFSITVDDAMAQIGSGALPEEELPSKVIAIRHPSLSAEKIAARFRDADPPNPPILGRIHDGTFLLDLRGIFDTHDLVLKIGDSTSTNS